MKYIIRIFIYSFIYFHILDIRGRIPVGAGTGGGLSARSLASTGGEETHTLTIDEIPSHSHIIPSFNDLQAAQSLTTEPAVNTNGTTNSGSTGGGQAHNNMQPFIVLNYIIKY